jgi:hypothetical protein
MRSNFESGDSMSLKRQILQLNKNNFFAVIETVAILETYRWVSVRTWRLVHGRSSCLLSAFAKRLGGKKSLRQVSPSLETNPPPPLDVFFVEVYSEDFSKTTTRFKFRSNRIIRSSHKDQQNVITPRRIFLGFKILQITVEKGISMLSDTFFFSKNLPLWKKNKKYGRSTKAKEIVGDLGIMWRHVNMICLQGNWDEQKHKSGLHWDVRKPRIATN